MRVATNFLYEVTTEQDWRDTAIVLQVLRPRLDIEAFVSDRKRLTSEGYRLIGLKVAEETVAVASYVLTPHPIHFRELQIHDMATLPSEQSKGYGRQLLNELDSIARREKCGRLYVNSGNARTAAHRFYTSNGFAEYSLGFIKMCANKTG